MGVAPLESSGGTTEFGVVGIGSATTQALFPTSASGGHFLAFTGDGGSSSDYRPFVGGVQAVNGDAGFLNGTSTANATGDSYQEIFEDALLPGSPANRWTTLTIRVAEGWVTYAFDGIAVARNAMGEVDEYVSLGYPDLFSSVANPFQAQFVVYDNLHVRVSPESTFPTPPILVNRLVNPGFESGTLDGWTGYTEEGVDAGGGYIEGTDALYFNGGNPGGSNVLVWNGFYVAKTFGDFSGVALTHAEDLMAEGNSAWIEVTFRDASDTVVSLYRSETLVANSVPESTWISLAITDQYDLQDFSVARSGPVLTAPPGTTTLRFQTVYQPTV